MYFYYPTQNKKPLRGTLDIKKLYCLLNMKLWLTDKDAHLDIISKFKVIGNLKWSLKTKNAI